MRHGLGTGLGWLGKRFGELRPLLAGFLGFAFAAWLCATTSEDWLFLAGRIALGLSGGVTLPLSQTLFLKEHPERRKTAAIAVWSIFTLAPAGLGPPIGGWFCDGPGWRWLFILDIPIALSVAALLSALLYGRGHSATRLKLDALGVALVVVVVYSFQTLINIATDEDWLDSRLVIAWGISGILALAAFIVWELRHPQPFLDLRLFAHRNYRVGVAALVVGFLTIQGLLTFFVVQLQSTVGYPAFLAGLFYLPMVVFAKPMANLCHHLSKRLDARVLAGASFLGLAATYFWISGFDRVASYQLTYWPKLLEGACLGAFFVPLTVILLHGIPAAQQARAGELANLLRLWAGAIGIPTQTAIWYRRNAWHQTHLVENLTPLDERYSAYLQHFTQAGYSEQAAQAKLYKLVLQQSQIDSLSEVFWIAGCIFLILFVFIWMAQPTYLTIRPKPREEVRQQAIEELLEEP